MGGMGEEVRGLVCLQASASPSLPPPALPPPTTQLRGTRCTRMCVRMYICVCTQVLRQRVLMPGTNPCAGRIPRGNHTGRRMGVARGTMVIFKPSGREGLSRKMMFEQKLERSERMKHMFMRKEHSR